MKKSAFIALILALALVLCSCGGGSAGGNNTANSNTGSSETNSQSGEQNNAEDYYFQTGDVKIHMQDPSAPLLEKLGEAKSSYEAPSCAFDGTDVIYSYPGFDLLTFVDKGDGIVSGVVLRDDTVETIEGIFIGSDKAAVESAYGKLADGASNLRVTKGSCELIIILTDGSVSSIQYIPASSN